MRNRDVSHTSFGNTPLTFNTFAIFLKIPNVINLGEFTSAELGNDQSRLCDREIQARAHPTTEIGPGTHSAPGPGMNARD